MTIGHARTLFRSSAAREAGNGAACSGVWGSAPLDSRLPVTLTAAFATYLGAGSRRISTAPDWVLAPSDTHCAATGANSSWVSPSIEVANLHAELTFPVTIVRFQTGCLDISVRKSDWNAAARERVPTSGFETAPWEIEGCS
jgi:hypothetical protein